jgi:hypothetical protein
LIIFALPQRGFTSSRLHICLCELLPLKINDRRSPDFKSAHHSRHGPPRRSLHLAAKRFTQTHQTHQRPPRPSYHLQAYFHPAPYLSRVQCTASIAFTTLSSGPLPVTDALRQFSPPRHPSALNHHRRHCVPCPAWTAASRLTAHILMMPLRKIFQIRCSSHNRATTLQTPTARKLAACTQPWVHHTPRTRTSRHSSIQ